MQNIIFLYVLVPVLLASCGVKDKRSNSDSGLSHSDLALADQGRENEQNLMRFDVKVVEKDVPGLVLPSSAQAYDIKLRNCATGYEGDFNETQGSLLAYRLDRGCQVHLLQFEQNSATYSPSAKGGMDFKSSAQGQVAIFANVADSTDTVSVVITSTLQDPVQGTEEVVFTFAQKAPQKSAINGQNLITDTRSLIVGNENAPQFSIANIVFNGVSATGAGRFTFTLICDDNKIEAADLSRTCAGQKIQDLRYKMIEDTFFGTMTYAQAATVMASGASKFAVQQISADNGGLTLALTGPDSMHLHPNIILLLSFSDKSFRYFSIDASSLN